LKETLPRNLADNSGYSNCRFVVLSYGDRETRDYLLSVNSASIESGYLTVYFHSADGFHMAHAKNMAARCGVLEGADILVTQDADNFTGPGFARFIADNPRGAYICPDFAHIQSLPFGPERPGRGYYGRLAIRSQDFMKLGGYDEQFDTWRGEDTDILARLERAGYERKFFRNRFLNVIQHDAAVRFKEYPHAQEWEEKNKTNEMLRSIQARTETVVNGGHFGLGRVYRNFSSSPIDITAAPTRIFGIGMQRTGTTSLGEAFEILGFDSWHFNNGNDARLIWEETNHAGKSRTLERWYALCDNPMPLLYRQLDRSYPGAKFILTIRGEAAWLDSVRRLWSPDDNPHRWTWDVYPISNRLHAALYGREDFDATIFAERYRRHNAEVREYFKGRSGDLLVMDMDAAAGWPELCGFLGLPIPAVPYPMKNQKVRMGSCPFDPQDETFQTPTAAVNKQMTWPLCRCGKELWHDGPCSTIWP
jgi:hypothetical protein